MGNLGVSQIDSLRVQQRAQQQTKPTEAREESVSFFDEEWSGHQIAKLTGDNFITDWLQNKDKVCTDGKDDGKIGFWEGTKSFAKGLIGGIPKAIINHPLATVVTVGLGAAATALTGGAILPVLGAIGVASGVGMAGYGLYKSATAETDGEAKQALETMGMGVATTALSMKSAGKILEKASEAGVKSAHIDKDANVFQKTIQMFKAIPESLTKSKEWVRFKFDIPVAKIKNDRGFVVEKRYGDDVYRQYKGKYDYDYINNKQRYYNLSSEKLPNETVRIYDHTRSNTRLLQEHFANGAYKQYNKYTGNLEYERCADGTIKKYDTIYWRLEEETFPNGSYKKFDCKGNVVEELVVKSDSKAYYKNGQLVEETFADGTYKKYSSSVPGRVAEETLPDGTKINRWVKYNGIEKRFTQTTLKDGTYRVIDETTGRLFEERLADGTVKAYYSEYEGIKGDLTVVTKDGATSVLDTKTGNILKHVSAKKARISGLSSSYSTDSPESLPNGATPSMHITNLSTGDVTSYYDVEDCPSYATRELYESLGYHFVSRH